MSDLKLGNLLLIDDEVLILEKSQIILEDYADNVFIADSGKKGLEVLSGETPVHCVVCDINMPEMNGIEVIKEVRKFNEDIPFIFYTGHGSDGLMKQALLYGAFDFLDKPGLDGLEEVVQRGLATGIGSDVTASDFQSEFEKVFKKK